MRWCYFSGDDKRAGASTTDAESRKRSYLALTAFGLDHFLMIFGLVVFASGVKATISDIFADAPASWRYVGAVLCAATGFIGITAPVVWQLLLLLVTLAGVVLAEAARVGGPRAST